MKLKDLFTRTPTERRHYGVAVLVGIVSGVLSAFVKWGPKFLFHPGHFLWEEMSLILRTFFSETIWGLIPRKRSIPFLNM